MSGWKKVKNLFWESGEVVEGAPSDLSDEEFAALLSDSPHAVPEASDAEIEVVDLTDVSVAVSEGGGLSIDFQKEYDAAGIPNTDEVEQLEAFLTRLDASLPSSAKRAAAEAFLGAIGKRSEDVLEDAARKIARVRSMKKSKQDAVGATIEMEHEAINALQAQIEQHRQAIQTVAKEGENFGHACLLEESRLQAARVFFGSAGAPGATQTTNESHDP